MTFSEPLTAVGLVDLIYSSFLLRLRVCGLIPGHMAGRLHGKTLEVTDAEEAIHDADHNWRRS